jgi:hypothetical protein
MQGITRWVLIFDAERFSQKKLCTQKVSLNSVFKLSFGGAGGLYGGFSRSPGPISLLFFQVFIRQQERRPAGG